MEAPEWMEAGCRWMGRCQAGGSGSGSGIEIVGDGLVELVFRNRIGLGEIELESLIQEEVTLRRAPGRGEGWRAVGEVEVEEDPLNDGGIGEEGQDPHVSATTRAEEGQHLIDACEELGPATHLRWVPSGGFARRR